MVEGRRMRHDRMGYSVAKPSNEEPGLVAVEEAGLEGRRERDDDEREQGDCGW
jgi:hypothetical protein